MKRYNSFWPTTPNELENFMFLQIACPVLLAMLFGNLFVGFGQIILLISGIILGFVLGTINFRYHRGLDLATRKPLVLNINGKNYELNKSEIASHDVDPQNGFTPLCPNELPVAGGIQIVYELNSQAKFASIRTCSKDMHNPYAYNIASAEHPQFSPITDHRNLDLYWNSHCQSGTFGSQLIEGLPNVTEYNFVAYKGMESDMHPYGACYHDLAKKMSTGLIEFYRQHKITTVIVGGLATDYCVKETVLELIAAGFNVVLNTAACRGVALDTTTDALNKMSAAGAILVRDSDALESLKYKG